MTKEENDENVLLSVLLKAFKRCFTYFGLLKFSVFKFSLLLTKLISFLLILEKKRDFLKMALIF